MWNSPKNRGVDPTVATIGLTVLMVGPALGGHASTRAGRGYSRGWGDHRRHRYRQAVAPETGARSLVPIVEARHLGDGRRGRRAAGEVPVGERNIRETIDVEITQDSRC